MTGEWWIGKDLEGNGYGIIKVVSLNLPGWTEEIQENLCPSRDSKWNIARYFYTGLFCPAVLPPGDKAPGTHWNDVGWGPEQCYKEKILFPLSGMKPAILGHAARRVR
jgi:hypothetical protein